MQNSRQIDKSLEENSTKQIWKFHKEFMKGMAPSRGEKGEVVTELHSPFPSHINLTTLTDVIYNIFLHYEEQIQQKLLWPKTYLYMGRLHWRKPNSLWFLLLVSLVVPNIINVKGNSSTRPRVFGLLAIEQMYDSCSMKR